jgi:putative DNA primase/helicase
MTLPSLGVTYFDDYAAVRKNERQISLEQLAEQIRSANAAEKDALPWLKLARFGNATTEHGSLRHDRNVISVTGCEVDYDGEQVGLDAAIEALEKAGVQAIAYTTPSYRPEAPRWRVLCPFSRDLAPPLRAKMVNRLNGLLKGVANSESWTLSQSYYFGRVNGNPDHRVELIDGLPLDELDELDLIAIGKPAGVKGGNGAAQPAAGGPIDETALRNAILHGENYHLACVRLVGKWAHNSVPFLDAERELYALFDGVFPPERDARWKQRRRDVPRIIADIYGKEAERRDVSRQRSAPPRDEKREDDPDPPRKAARTRSRRQGNGSWPDEYNDVAQIHLERGDGLPMEKIEWLWPGWLARGKFHLLAGSKGAGKSTILFDLMARLSTGAAWPDGNPASSPSNVMVWSGEDGITDTILPRFYAAGGDRKRIYFPTTATMTDGTKRQFDPSTDMSALIEAAAPLPELGLVMIDPVVLALPSRSDSHKNSETRHGLQPLVDFADQRRIAVMGVTHFTKGTHDRDPIERVTGSLAFGALPRCVWGASADDDGYQRRLVRVASNIGPSGGGIEYTLYQAPLPDYDFSAQRVDWGKKLQGSARELLNADKRSAEAEAAALLSTLLSDGPKPQREIKEAADAHCQSWATIRRAQETLGIKPKKEGKVWCWSLPQGKHWQDAQ